MSTRQEGSCIRLDQHGGYFTIPNHRPLKTGTLLGAVLKPVVAHQKLSVEALLDLLDL